MAQHARNRRQGGGSNVMAVPPPAVHPPPELVQQVFVRDRLQRDRALPQHVNLVL
jgi:hypothetical protein